MKREERKKKMIDALRQAHGVVARACDAVGISRKTHYRWLNEDNEYAQEVEEIAEEAIDFAESALFDKIGSGDTTSIIFCLKTRGKKRGYTEEQKIALEMLDYKFKFGE